MQVLTRSAGAWAALALVGCSAIRIDEGPAEATSLPDHGEILLSAVGGRNFRRQVPGYTFTVAGPPGLVATVASEEGPWSLEDLPPGPYEVALTGNGMQRQVVKLDVRARRRTSMTFIPGGQDCSRMASDLALVAGKTVFYIGLGVAYVVYAACKACIDEALGNDDDEDDDIEEDRWHRPPPPRYTTTSSSSRSKSEPGKPRVRSLLKDPP